MPIAGEVFVKERFVFEDGSTRDKWFVVLNQSEINEPCLALKTTSVPDRYIGCTQGCNQSRRCFFTPNAWQSCFRVDTFIQLPQIIEFPSDKLIKAGFDGEIIFKGSITSDCLSQLKSCLARFKDDISTIHWNLIYRNR
jgi:hypothetical protein